MDARMLPLWVSVLDRPVGPDDDFFTDLGGGSLEALELLDRLLDEFGVLVTFQDLMANPTPVRLAGAVSRLQPVGLDEP